jgi:hypothetical protein
MICIDAPSLKCLVSSGFFLPKSQFPGPRAVQDVLIPALLGAICLPRRHVRSRYPGQVFDLGLHNPGERQFVLGFPDLGLVAGPVAGTDGDVFHGLLLIL